MPISLHDATIPVFRHKLGVLATLLDKGEAHAKAAGLDPAALVTARLAPDMLTLAGQVQRASDSARLGVARLAGVTAPSIADDETSLDALRQRIKTTVDYIGGFTPEQFDGAETREVVLGQGSSMRRFHGTDYVLDFALPNFMFHIVTAYDILRMQGVEIGKRDFLGGAGLADK